MTVQIDVGFMLITSKQFGLKMDVADMIDTLNYAANYETLHHYIVTTKAFVGTSPIFSFCFVVQACVRVL